MMRGKKNSVRGNKYDLKGKINSLQSISASFSSEAVSAKKTLLQEISISNILNPKLLFQYHQLLLFLSAYPASKQLLHLAEQELNRVAVEAKRIFTGKNESFKFQLTNTGMANTQINVCFSFHFVKWLITEFPDAVSLFSIDANDATAEQVLCACLNPVVRDLIADKMLSPVQMINRVKNETEDDLKFLVRVFDELSCSAEVRDSLWDSLKVFVSWKLNENAPSLTNAKSPARKFFFHRKPFLKKFDFRKEIEKDLSAGRTEANERRQLILAARGVLAMFLRETDPVTYADEKEIALFDSGRGIDIALYPMIAERRLPLESYIGYVAFKNRIPVAYGGGWIFLHRSKIGINIFPAFRGGESAFIFCQILRVFYHHYKVKKFIVEPYQIGKNNTEGLRSGAYWFYYRLGFRSIPEKLKLLAEKEFEMISADKSYRSPLSVMKQLSRGNLELNLESEEKYADIDPLTISAKVKDRMNGNSNSEKKMSGSELVSDVFGLQKSDRKKLLQLFNRKFTGIERDFIFLAQKEIKLFSFLQNKK